MLRSAAKRRGLDGLAALTPASERLRLRWQDVVSPRRGDLFVRRYATGGQGLVVQGPALVERHPASCRIELGRDVIIAGGLRLSLQAPEATLRIGDGVFVNRDVQIDVKDRVTIGHGTNIGFGVTVLDSDFHVISGTGPPTLPVAIGADVLVCSRATILKGVQVGDGAVIGAGSVVTRDVPPGTLVAGAPARVVREDVTWSGGRYDRRTGRRDVADA